MLNHACGAKSFHAVSYDARDMVTGEEPDLHTLWQLTRKRASGEWVDEASKEIHDKVVQQIGQCSGNEIARIEPEIIESAFMSLVGKKSNSHKRGIASGSSIRNQVKQLQTELEAQKKETEDAREKYNEVRAKLVEVESQLMEEHNKREELEVRLVDRQREMDEINSQVQRAIQAALSQPKPLD
ncbi:uncharacterized protein LOC129284820 isoform X2 [Prosopis cineraria]|uniref:uncharacterized protein LOC129284820 isoform X2 n=1 Tax=Prosopis cineraria TaxID=364024 RepID=UPI00240F9450|nr:uncharacterized protein LOC129284820 isoform X2 [Prosopis cineraria]